MKHIKQKAFTLVELIVVVTILAILATIGFVSYSSYLTWVRDTNRLAQLVSISDGLELYRTTKDLPLPDDSVEVSINGSLIAYQGTAGSNTLETIDFTKGWVDPRDGTYFSYYLTKDRKHYQLLWFLEEEASITSQNTNILPPQLRGIEGELSLIEQTQAVTYDNRIPTVYGRKLWILTNDQNTPIEQAWADLDITAATTWYIAHMTDTETLSWSSLQSINPKANCKRIKQLRWWSSDWVYEINPTGVEDAEFDVYCDMTTDWGGWTALVRINPSIKNSNEWHSDVWTAEGEYYNYMNKAWLFSQKEIYTNKTLWYDGWEYLFEVVDWDVYARRWFFKDINIKPSWSGLNWNLTNWLNLVHNTPWFSYEWSDYPYLWHTNTITNFFDFPFIGWTSDNLTWLSDNWWGGRDFDDNVDAYIFVR